MDSQVAHPHGPTFDDQNDPYNTGLPSGEGVDQQQPQGKTSVLMKKVKAKAKKIKDSLAKHAPGGYGHDHGHADEQIGREYHHVEEEEEEDDDNDVVHDDDQEMVENPEIHGAPMHESAAPKQDVNKGESGVSFGKVDVMEDVPKAPVSTPVYGTTNQTRVDDGIKKFEHVQQGNQGEGGVHLGRSLELKEDPDSPKDGPESYKPANYQAKVADPTCAGGEEAGIAPILNSFEKMSVYDEPESKSHHQKPHIDQHILPTETHDQFTPDHQEPQYSDQDILPTKTHDQFTPDHQEPQYSDQNLPTTTHDQFTSDHQEPQYSDQHILPTKTYDQFTPDHQEPQYSDQHILPTKTHDQFTPDHQEPQYSDQHLPTTTHDQFTPDHQNPHIDQHILPSETHDQFTTDHQKPPIDQHIQPTKIHDQFTPDTQNPPIDQHLLPTGTHDQFTPDISMPTERDSDQPLDHFTPDISLPTKTESDQPFDDLPTIKESGSPKIQSPTSTYTEKLSYATSAITGTAISAKNVVASKFGYGAKDENSPVSPVTESHNPLDPVMESREVGEGETTKAPSQGGGYGSTIYNTVAGAGTTVMSKVTGRGTGSETEDVVGSKPEYGHGGKDDNNLVNPVTEPREIGEGETTKSSSPVGGGYGSTIASKFTPVYNTVAGAGATVMSKVTGRGTDTGTGSETEDVGGEGPDKSVPVKQSSWVEKLKPGEEDKALSEAISGALYKRNDEGTKHNKEDKPMGKVTESEEVARQLGTGDEHSGEERVGSGEVKVNGADASGANKGMVNMVKGAVTSWFGKGEVGHVQEGTEEHKVQESSK